jgi:hypothetical protein
MERHEGLADGSLRSGPLLIAAVYCFRRVGYV